MTRNSDQRWTDPNPHAGLISYIQGVLPNLKRARRRIADAILFDPERFISGSIYDLAGFCRVSTGSIVQFCKLLGLKGFSALKIALARDLTETVLSLGRKTKPYNNHPVNPEDVFEYHIASLRQTLKLNKPGTFNAAVKSVLRAKHIFLFSIGLSYPVAYFLSTRLRFIGLPAFIEFDSHLQLAAAAGVKRGDVALAVSVAGTTGETVECLRLSKERGATTICITNSVGSPLAQAAHFALYAAPSEVKYFQAPLAPRVTQLALADALLVLIGQRRKRQALSHIRRTEEYLLRRRTHNAPTVGGSGRKQGQDRPPASAAGRLTHS